MRSVTHDHDFYDRFLQEVIDDITIKSNDEHLELEVNDVVNDLILRSSQMTNILNLK